MIAAEQDRADVVEQRAAWRAAQEFIDPARVVFIDETWAKTNMTRTYGRSELGTRLVDKTPCGRWQTTTFLGALRAEGFIAPLTVEGGIDGALFRAWVEQHLAPLLKAGDIVVMDNLVAACRVLPELSYLSAPPARSRRPIQLSARPAHLPAEAPSALGRSRIRPFRFAASGHEDSPLLN